MLLDSNAIIYAIKPTFSKLRELIKEHNPSVSSISYLEVLGYHQLTCEDELDFKEFFKTAPIIHVSQPVLEHGVQLRQQRKMSLGDAIVGATAIVNNLTLVTANTDDFKWIQNIRLLNPLSDLNEKA